MFSNPYPWKNIPLSILLVIGLNACTKANKDIVVSAEQESSLNINPKKNVIIILEDDIGYEIPAYTGGQSYKTPQMDAAAQKGMQFTHCYSSAMCSPSRVSLLTGKYGFRNYYWWGVLDSSQKTIANMLRDNGYSTCVAGKWQLDGGDAGIHGFGFDDYCVFDPVQETDSSDTEENKYRYKNPALFQDGAYLSQAFAKSRYSDDIFADYALDFIDRNKKKNFFLYFSFSECHQPFSPPPDNPYYASFDPLTSKTNKGFFPGMVSYMDSKISAILNKVQEAGLSDKTYIFILGDNGTDKTVNSIYKGRQVTGGKTFTNEFGLHVPLIVIGPSITPGSINKNIVDFTDIMPTIAQIAKIPKTNWGTYGMLDGIPFYKQFATPDIQGRTWSYGYFLPYPQNKVQQKVYVQDTAYKLYDNTNGNYFYNIQKDSLEQAPIPDNKLTNREKKIKQNFQNVLAGMHN
jgi:arylsulfatase A